MHTEVENVIIVGLNPEVFEAACKFAKYIDREATPALTYQTAADLETEINQTVHEILINWAKKWVEVLKLERL